MYLVLDLQTIGFSRSSCNVIDLAGETLGPDGISIEDGYFTSLIKPPNKIPQVVMNLTGIANDMVKDMKKCCAVVSDFVSFVEEKVDKFN